MFSFHYSLIEAYKTGFKQLYKNIFQYFLWLLIVGVVSVLSVMALGIYVEILNFAAIKQHFLNFIYSLYETTNFDASGVTGLLAEREVSFHTILSYFLPMQYLNQSLMSLTMMEYVHLILQPKWLGLLLLGLVALFCSSLVYVGFVKSAFKLQNKGKMFLVDMIAHCRYVMPYLVAAFIAFFVMSALPFLISLSLSMFLFLFFQFSIPSTVVMVLGCVYFVYMMVRLYFVLYFIFDQNSGVFQSIKQSWHLTRTSKFAIFVFMLSSILFAGVTQSLFGFIGCKVLGFMLSFVVLVHASIYIFKALLAKQEQAV